MVCSVDGIWNTRCIILQCGVACMFHSSFIAVVLYSGVQKFVLILNVERINVFITIGKGYKICYKSVKEVQKRGGRKTRKGQPNQCWPSPK